MIPNIFCYAAPSMRVAKMTSDLFEYRKTFETYREEELKKTLSLLKLVISFILLKTTIDGKYPRLHATYVSPSKAE